MIEILDRYLTNFLAQKTESHEMALRYDGAIQALEAVRADLTASETTSGPRDPVPPTEIEAAEPTPAARRPTGRSRARKVPSA